VNIHTCTQKRRPVTAVTFNSIDKLQTTHQRLTDLMGIRKGCVQGLKLTVSGNHAINLLRLLEHKIPSEFENWVPKQDPTKYLRLPDSHFIQEAQKYRERHEWKKKSGWSYQHVHSHRRHLLPQCTAHMAAAINPFSDGYQVYAYEFEDKSAYVGITCAPHKRRQQHQERGTVAEKRKTTPSNLLEVASGLPANQAAKKEEETIQHYKSNGWTLLNKEKGGSLGQIRSKYTYDRVLEIARPCSTKFNFLKTRPEVFQAASKYGYLRRLEKDLQWPENANRKWAYNMCLESAKQHKYITDWLEADQQAYHAAQSNGWMPKLKKEHFTVTKQGMKLKWNPVTCLERAKQFTHRSDWQYLCRDGSYIAARKKGWLQEIADKAFAPTI